MSGIFVQAPAATIMIRPTRFRPNPATREDNAFQADAPDRSDHEIAAAAFREVTDVVDRLRAAGVAVHLFEDESSSTPDSVFPNNWFSTHSGGRVALFPMYSPSRQRERRTDVVELLKSQYRVQEIVDYSGLEPDRVFLEGTGAMVLDHIDRVAYAARSRRTNEAALARFCASFNYEPMLFDAFDPSGREIYHTNVLMCVATEFALVGLSSIADPAQRDEVRHRLEETGRTVLDLTPMQVAAFAGNAIELTGTDGRVLAISARAVRALDSRQLAVIEASATVLPMDVPTIELAGGSVRCMIAGVHLRPRPASQERDRVGAKLLVNCVREGR